MINASSTFFLEKKRWSPPALRFGGQAKIQAQSMRSSLILLDTSDDCARWRTEK
jgi:hypothetical protein